MKTLLSLLVLAVCSASFAADRSTVVVISSEINRDAPAALTAPAGALKYFLQIGGYEEIGSLPANRRPTPDGGLIAGAVRDALDPAHFIAEPTVDAADLIIRCDWGELSPRGPQFPVSMKPGGTTSMMRALLVGRSVRPPFLSNAQQSELNFEAKEDRYFLLVTAYDPQALREKKPAIVWQTRLSAESLRTHPADVWTTMARAGRAYFGEDLEKPVVESFPVVSLEGVAPVTPAPASDLLPTAREIF